MCVIRNGKGFGIPLTATGGYLYLIQAFIAFLGLFMAAFDISKELIWLNRY